MKIIYLHQYFNTPEQAGGTRSYEMARRLVSNGHEVHIITSWRKPIERRTWFETIEAGIHVHWYPVQYSNSMGNRDRMISFLRFAVASALRAASLNGDVILATSTPLSIAFPGIFASFRKKIPLVFEVRDLWPEIPIAIGAIKSRLLIVSARYLEFIAYRLSKHIIALSPGMKDGIVKTGYSEDKISVIPNSCDLDLFNVPSERGCEYRSRYEWLGERPLIVYAGTIGFMNGVDFLAQLAACIMKIEPEVRFLVVGKGKEETKVRKIAEELGIYNVNFFMVQEVAKREMPYILSAATMATSLFINLKEMWANSANKFFDALASGKPIAINYEGWQADLLRQTGAGLVLNPENIIQSAEELVKAIKNEDWLIKAGNSSRMLAQDRFSRDVLAKEFEKVLVNAVPNTI